jgi:subtilase family serine protease
MLRLSVEWLERRIVPARPTPGVTNPTPVGLTPVEVRHAYGFDQIPGLAENYNVAGAGQTIAIVMAGHDPNIASDLHVFSQTFGLPDATLVQLNQTGSASGPWTGVNASWAGEIALDVEWAHAIAPAAKIVLVEANSARLTDLATAIDTARKYPGVSAVSMSWGLLQGPGMDAYESYFTTPAGHTPITFVAATLDNGLTLPNNLYWPSVSPRVLAVGGTSLTLDSQGNYQGEVGWGPSTGGISTWFAQPAYQQGVVTQSTTYRTVPDVSYHADNTVKGFAVYDTVPYNRQTGWFNAYGDSAGAPQWAALVVIANQERAAAGLPTLDGASQVLPGLYALASAGYSTYYHDITTGGNGRYSAGVGYDLVTGLGTPKADALVPALASLSGSGASVSFPPPTGSDFSGSGQGGGGFESVVSVAVVSPMPLEQPIDQPTLVVRPDRPVIFLAPPEAKKSPWDGSPLEFGWAAISV